MVVSSAIGALMSWNVPLVGGRDRASLGRASILTALQKKRAIHTITTLVLITSSISYFAMATGHAVSWKRDTFNYHHHDEGYSAKVVFRQVFWARFVDWAITTPLLLLNVGLLSGMAGAHIVMLVAADLVLVLSGLFAAMSNTQTQHWGWYTIACLGYIFVAWHLLVNSRVSAAYSRSDQAQRLAGGLSSYTLLLWALYVM
jgi:bacteriorhodopsin